MLSNGSGHPLTLRCSKCKRGSHNGESKEGTNLEATGEVKPLLRRQALDGARTLPYRARYRCGDCGHEGWSRHERMEELLKQGGFLAPSREQVIGGLRTAEKSIASISEDETVSEVT